MLQRAMAMKDLYCSFDRIYKALLLSIHINMMHGRGFLVFFSIYGVWWAVEHNRHYHKMYWCDNIVDTIVEILSHANLLQLLGLVLRLLELLRTENSCMGLCFQIVSSKLFDFYHWNKIRYLNIYCKMIYNKVTW